MNIKKYLDKNTKSLLNKTIVVTGATGGIGKEFCRDIALLNGNLILVSRSINKLEQLKNELLNINKKIKIDILICDFLDIDSVKKVCDELNNYKINYFVHNAGAYHLPKENTSFGYNNIFQINTIVPYYMSKKLMKNIKQNKGKMIVVNSIASKFQKLDTAEIEFINHRPLTLYGNSKRWEILGLVTLYKEYNVNYSIVHPGVTLTNITSNYKQLTQKIIKYPMKLIFISNQCATLNLVNGLFMNAKYPYWIGPKYFDIWGKPSIKQCKIKDNFNFIYKKLNDIYDEIEKR